MSLKGECIRSAYGAKFFQFIQSKTEKTSTQWLLKFVNYVNLIKNLDGQRYPLIENKLVLDFKTKWSCLVIK